MRGLIFSLVVFIFLGGVVPVVLLSTVEGAAGYKGAGLLAFLPLLYGASRASLSLRRNSAPVLVSIFGVFVYMNFGLSSLLQGYSNTYYWPGLYAPEEVRNINLLAIVGCLCFEIGLFIAGKKITSSRIGVERQLSSRRLRWIAILGFFLIALMLYVSGWYRAVFAVRSYTGEVAGQAAMVSTSTAQLFLISTLRSLPFTISISLWLFFLAGRKNRLVTSPISEPFSQAVILGLAVTYSIITLILANPVSTPRYWFGTVVTAYVIIGCDLLGLSARRWVPGLLLGGYLFVFPVADTFRREFSLHELGEFFSGNLPTSLADSLKSGDYDSFQQSMNSLAYVRENSLQYGKQLLGSALFFVPRSMWPEKPTQSGPLIAGITGYEYTNLACPLWAEGYLDFGLFGTVLILCVFGMLIGYAELRSARNNSAANPYYLFIVLFSGYEIFFLRGALMSAVAYFASTLLFVLLVQRKVISAAPVRLSRIIKIASGRLTNPRRV